MVVLSVVYIVIGIVVGSYNCTLLVNEHNVETFKHKRNLCLNVALMGIVWPVGLGILLANSRIHR